MLSTDHLILLLPVTRPGPQEAVCQTEPGLRAGGVRPVTWTMLSVNISEVRIEIVENEE